MLQIKIDCFAFNVCAFVCPCRLPPQNFNARLTQSNPVSVNDRVGFSHKLVKSNLMTLLNTNPIYHLSIS